MKAGLLLMSAGVGLLLAGPKMMGILCIAASGVGMGLAVPAANLLVAEVNPRRRSATLNLLNFCWSAGAVACPFLVAAAAKSHQIPLFLAAVAGFALLVAIGIAAMPSYIVEPSAPKDSVKTKVPRDSLEAGRHTFILAALFFLYVGVENGFGGWVASYAKSLGESDAGCGADESVIFLCGAHAGEMAGAVAVATDRRRFDWCRLGLLIACAGMAGLVLSHGLRGVVVSASARGTGAFLRISHYDFACCRGSLGPASSRVGSFMFTMSNIGGGLMPWMVGVSSNHFGTLKAGLAVPLIGCAAMYGLYLRGRQARWKQWVRCVLSRHGSRCARRTAEDGDLIVTCKLPKLQTTFTISFPHRTIGKLLPPAANPVVRGRIEV